MSFISKLFASLGYLFQIIVPFIFIFLLLAAALVFLFSKDIISVSSLVFFSFSSFFTIFSLISLFLLITITMFFPSIYKYTRIGAYVALSFLFFSLVGQEISIIKSFSEFANIKNRWMPCSNPSKFLDKVACLFTGYMPNQTTKDWETILIIYGFWLYAFSIPFFVSNMLMKDFVEASGVVQNPTYQKIIGIGFAFLLYKNLIITRLIDFLYIGGAGVLMIIINFLAINHTIKKIHRLFVKIKAIEEKEAKKRNIDELKRYVKSSLSKLKLIPSLTMISTVFEDRIRNNLKTIFESENRLDEYEALVTEFEQAVNSKDKAKALSVIDIMIAKIS